MPWAGGVYSRGYPSWTNDAANNLPISATKFDTEDNDFATGLNNTLTKDGLSTPNAAMTWGLSSAQVLAITRGSDGNGFSVGRTGGSNNPTLQIQLADATGIAINLSTAQQLALAINGTNVMALTGTSIALAQPTTITAPVGTVGATINGAANQYAALLLGSSTNAQSLGLRIEAGTTSADVALAVYNQANTTPFLFIRGDGSGQLGPNNTNVLTWATTGAWALAASTGNFPTLTINGNSSQVNGALYVLGGANQWAQTILGSSTSGQSFGLVVTAGTTSADRAFTLQNQAASASFMIVYGDGETLIGQPPSGTNQASPNWQVGYLDMPLNVQGSGNYQLVLTDRGKMIEAANAHTYTIPANASVAFPIGTTILVYSLSGGAVSIAITTDTLTWLPSGGTGTRTLANGSIATIYKVTATSWIIWGFGLT